MHTCVSMCVSVCVCVRRRKKLETTKLRDTNRKNLSRQRNKSKSARALVL